MFDINNLASIKVGLASPEKIREWSHGEVTKPETINYRSQKPEMDGLFCEKIFGPSKDYECHCGKYKKIRYAGVVCEKCGVEVISKEVRRERMGHIELATPCSHIWYLKGIPSRMGLVLDISPKALEEVVYFTAHLCMNPGTTKTLYYKEFLDDKFGRQTFITTIKEILAGLSTDTSDYARGQVILERLTNISEPFDFFGTSDYINEHTGATFGEGAECVKKLLQEVDLQKEFDKVSNDLKGASGQRLTKLTKRLEVLDAFIKSGNKPEWMILDAIPVIPPDLRPMLQLDGGRFAASDLNDLYRRVISRNNRLRKLIDMNAPYVILMNEKRMVQEAVDALIDNGRRNGKPVTGPAGRPLKSLSGGLKGKQGRFRQNLLGKRVDYSGRSVIAIGPSLKMYQCGIPREMAINLLRPFIAAILIKEGKCTLHRQADKKIDAKDEDVYDVVEKIISQHPVLLNRAPTLHRLGIQAFQPILVDGRAIRLHPLVCTGFNADFDGDQMAVHVPISKAAQEEALHLMLASNNILAPKDGRPIVTPSQDILIGNYYLTIEETAKDFLNTAKKYKDIGDDEMYDQYVAYSKMEGKVFKDINEVYKAYDLKKIHLHTRIAIPGSQVKKSDFSSEMMNGYLITTVGKVIFNLIFPADFPYLNSTSVDNLKEDQARFFVPKGTNLEEYIKSQPLNQPTKKKDITNIIDEVFHRYGTQKTSAILDKLKDNGFRFSTISGLTIAISDIDVLDEKKAEVVESDKEVDKVEALYKRGYLTSDERHKHIVSIWKQCNDKVENMVATSLNKDKQNPLFIMSDSGARGSKSNFAQLMGMRGLMGSTSGETIEIPVKSCFREGLNVAEFFTGTHGARKGGADTALKTADSGYLTRRLVDVSQDVIIREDDCHTDHGSFVEDIYDMQGKVIVALYDRLIGRFACHDIVNPSTGEIIVAGDTLIEDKDARAIVAAGLKRVEIRSLFGCQTRDGVCVHCYGKNLANGKVVEIGQAVGTMAAQSIGEPGTQLTLRTFHSGGVAGGDITQGLPRVQELFEARPPKGESTISEISGVVSKIVEKNGIFDVSIKNKLEEKTYTTNFGSRLSVKEGDNVTNGSKLTEGSINLKQLLEVSDIAAVREYIIREVNKVYHVEGISISDKHIEVIIHQMLSKIVVIDHGDTDLITGTRISINTLNDANAKAFAEGKRPAVAKPLILGITKAALETDSFLSAASFQETTRVLTDAAIKGKTDPLHGLKENVIAGKLIPAGNGLKTPEEERNILNHFDVLDTMKEVKKQYIGVHDSEHSLDDDNAEYRNEESLMTEDGSEYRNDRRPNRGPANNYSANMGNNRQDMDSQSIVNDIIQDSKTNE
jgi:DNA-directed RNA polymerase, beta'' subunit, predominant form